MVIQIDRKKIINCGLSVLDNEADALLNLKRCINEQFVKACELLLNTSGRIIVIGMGKSGHIASKIAATLASTGSPAFYVHPGDASHGDLGMITRRDVVLMISNSGNTPEILAIVPLIKRLGIPLIALTGNLKSTLAQNSTVVIDISVAKEACPLGLAPTSSTTAALAMGDALAIALLETRGFTKDDFALAHPGGSLGKRLLLKIDDLMNTNEEIPKVRLSDSVHTALLEMTAKTLGMTTIVDNEGYLAGVYTDGDLRRTLDRNCDLKTTPISEVMSKNCKTVLPDTLAYDALKLMEQHNITSLVVTDANKQILGVIHMHDILKAGII